MGSQSRNRPSQVLHVVKLGSKHGARWLYDFIASQLVGVGLTVLLVALGVGYKADDSRIDKAAIVAAKQAGSSEIADGYAAFAKQTNALKDAALEKVPESWREASSRISVIAAAVLLVAGCVLALARAPSRAHVVRDLGWGIAFPGVLAVLATAILEWRAMKGIKATLTGDRTAATLWSEGRDAAREAFPALGLPLAVGAVLLVVGIVLHRRWVRTHGRLLAPRHVLSSFLMIAGAVPWIHLVATILIEAVTEGATTGAMLAPWVDNRFTYLGCVGLFSFGGALFFAGRREIKRLEKLEAEEEEKAKSRGRKR